MNSSCNNAAGWGFPEIGETMPPAEGRAIAWAPGVSLKADWYLLQCHSGQISRYRAAGGTMSRAVVHFLTRDVGVIDPMWGRESYLKRIARLREMGVQNLVSPDFSSWAN